jgi:hypothetical protein
MRLIGVGLVSVLVLTACGDAVGEPRASRSQPTESSTSEPVPSGPEPELVDVAAVYERVEYYGACGNETVTVDGVTYYPILSEDLQKVELDRYPLVGALLGVFGSLALAPQVAPPGPGDDIGDLIVYVDGTARFESDSGWVIWLTDEEQTYFWEC